MIEGELNFIRREIQRVLDRRTRETVGIVTSYDPQTHAVKVSLQPEGQLTGWIPLRQSAASNGAGNHMAPNVGDFASIAFHEDDRDAATVTGFFFNHQSQPTEVQAGEWLYKHSSGSLLYFKADGSLQALDKAGSSAVLDGTGNIVVTPKGRQSLSRRPGRIKEGRTRW